VGLGCDCSLARCLLLLSWITSWTVEMPRSEWITELVTYHGAFTVARSSFDWNLCMIAMLDLAAQPHNRNAFKRFSVWHFKLMCYYIEVHLLAHYIQ
jgi:hypothetical protein